MSKIEFSTPNPTDIVIKRTFDAPRDLVWNAFTQCEYLSKWFAPEGWSLTECDMDLREGGSWRYCMSGPISETETMDSRGMAKYTEVLAPERLVYQDLFVDETYTPMDGMPVANITVTFAEVDGKTTVINRTSYPTQADRDKVLEMGVEVGITQTYDKLESMLLETV